MLVSCIICKLRFPAEFGATLVRERTENVGHKWPFACTLYFVSTTLVHFSGRVCTSFPYLGSRIGQCPLWKRTRSTISCSQIYAKMINVSESEMYIYFRTQEI
jgi:hypothetical protein